MKLIPMYIGSTNGSGDYRVPSEKFAKVDDEDYDYLMQWKWHSEKHKHCLYAARTERIFEEGVLIKRVKRFWMHRVVLKETDPKVFVDHINHDGLDNQKSNIRLCSSQQNSRNARKRKANTISVYKGVSKSRKRWCAYIRINRKGIHLGNYDREEDAAQAYNEAAIKYHGEFACINSIK